jgi:hypothetical protein
MYLKACYFYVFLLFLCKNIDTVGPTLPAHYDD